MQGIRITQRTLIEALRASCHKFGADDEAIIHLTEEGGVIKTSHFPSDKPVPTPEPVNNQDGH